MDGMLVYYHDTNYKGAEKKIRDKGYNIAGGKEDSPVEQPFIF